MNEEIRKTLKEMRDEAERALNRLAKYAACNRCGVDLNEQILHTENGAQIKSFGILIIDKF
jgi:signal-transduction protein with cAMP-binding, CBS, and nucleotidyltransferase domain